MKVQALAASVALLASAGAQATFDNDTSSVLGGGTGAGSMVLSVVERTAVGPDPYVNVDFGPVADYLSGSVAAGTIVSTGVSELTDLLTAATGPVEWVVQGIENNGSTFDLGLLTTADSSAPNGFTQSEVGNILTDLGSWFNSNDGNDGGTGIVAGADAAADLTGFDNSNHLVWQSVPAGGPYDPVAELGQTMALVGSFAGFGPNGLFADLGAFTLLNDGDLCFGDQAACAAPVIPIPAAVWLFGSAVVGLVGVARRRAA